MFYSESTVKIVGRAVVISGEGKEVRALVCAVLSAVVKSECTHLARFRLHTALHVHRCHLDASSGRGSPSLGISRHVCSSFYIPGRRR